MRFLRSEITAAGSALARGIVVGRAPLGGVGLAFVLVIGIWLANRPADFVIPEDDLAPPLLRAPFSADIDIVIPPDIEPAPPPVMDAPPPWSRHKIRRRDTMAKILSAIGADDEARAFLLSQKFKTYRKLRVGDALEYRKDGGGKLAALRYKTSPEYYLTFHRGDDGELFADEAPPALRPARNLRGGDIQSSLFEATDRAGIADGAVSQLIDALETRLDFHRDLRVGDSFRLLYPSFHDEDGDIVKVGRLLAFSFINRGREIAAIYNEDAGGFYTPQGESSQSAFLRSPVKFSRVSSRFTHRRFHPVLKKWRAHRGVDYAARRGTKVRATGDGVVTFAGRKGGYGKVIFIKHFNIYTTVYGHLSKIAPGIKKGKRVAQGQFIGRVGATGLATGPHLHYEFRIRGAHKDPLSAAVPVKLPPLKGEDLAAHKARAARLLAELREAPLAATR